MKRQRPARNGCTALKSLAAAALLACAGGGQAIEVVGFTLWDQFTAPVGDALPSLGDPSNWIAYWEDHYWARPVALDATVTATMKGAYGGLASAWLNRPAAVTADTTLRSLHILSYEPDVTTAGGASRLITRAAGSDALLTLVGGGGASLIVGTAGGGDPGDRVVSPVTFQGVAMNSAVSALIHPGGEPELAGASLWAHAGSIVVGASTPTGGGANDYLAATLRVSGSSLVPALGQRLEIVVGSAGQGAMYVNSETGPGTVETHVLTVGGELAHGTVTAVGSQAFIRVHEALRVGRGAEGKVTVTGGGQLQASTGQIGFMPSTVPGDHAGILDIGARSRVEFLQREVIDFWGGRQVSGGTLDVGTAEWPASGMRGELRSAAGSQLLVDSTMAIGGAGAGSAVLHGSVQAAQIHVGQGYAGGSGRLETYGDLVVGNPADINSERVSLQGDAQWWHGGIGQVHGSVYIGSHGGNVGQAQQLRVLAGGTLQVDRSLDLGVYYDSNVSPILQVDHGGSLTVGQPGAEPLGYGHTVSISGRGQWIQSGHAKVHGDVAIGEWSSGSALPLLKVAAGGRFEASGRIVAGSAGGMPDGPLRAQVVIEDGGVLQTDDALVLNTNTLLSGRGTVDGRVLVNGGIVAPGMSPGRLTILGDLRFGDSPMFGAGRLVIELGSPAAPGGSYDVLDVRGQLDLGSATVLEVRLLDGFDPAGGYSFLRYGSVAGDGAGGSAWFSQVEVFDASGAAYEGLDFERQGNQFGRHLALAVPEPSQWLLLALGGLALLGRTRRRPAATPG